MTTESCTRCGGPIPPDRQHPGKGRPRSDGTPNTPPKRFCSYACGRAENKERTQELLDMTERYNTCAWCHELYEMKRMGSRFCCLQHLKKFNAKRLLDRLSLARHMRDGDGLH